MSGISMLSEIVLFLITLMAQAWCQESNIYRNDDYGIEIQKPDSWYFEIKDGSHLSLRIKPSFTKTDSVPARFVFVVTSLPGMTSKDLVPLRETLWKSTFGVTYKKIKQDTISIANEITHYLFFESNEGYQLHWEEYYLVKDNMLYLMQCLAPTEIFAGLEKDFHFIRDSFKFIQTGEDIILEKTTEEILKLDGPENRAVFLCDMTSMKDGDFMFLSAIPAAARLNQGRPVILVTNNKLSESVKHFLKRYNPGKVYTMGSNIQGVAGIFVEQPNQFWQTSDIVVLSEKKLPMAVMAAPLAAKLNCPLLFYNENIEDELKRLKAKFLIIIGEPNFNLVKSIAKVTRLKTPIEVASFSRDFDYVAVTNTYLNQNNQDKSYLFAAMLAAYHKGVVYPICEQIQFHFGIVEEKLEEDEKMYLSGKIKISQTDVKVKVPIRDKEQQPYHFNDPYVDIQDGNGFVLTKIGDEKVINGESYAFSMRMKGILGITKFHDHQHENRVLLIKPHASSIQKELIEFYKKTSLPQYVTIVGNPATVPFGYQRDPVYFNSTMHEQELATDNTFANIDEDAYLELAVGRIVNPDIYSGSLYIAQLVTYDEIGGDWQNEALMIYPAPKSKAEESPYPVIFASFEALLKNIEKELNYLGFKVTGFYGDEGTLDNVYPHLQQKALIVYAQHSDAYSWSFTAGGKSQSLLPYWSQQKSKLPQDIKVVPYLSASPLIIGLGCDSGGLDTGVDPKKAFIFGCFEKGAIGYIGNTRAGFPDTEEHVIKQMINEMLYSDCSIGDAFKNGKNYLHYLFKNEEPYQISIFKDYRLAYEREFYQLVYYGDPALKFKVPITPKAVKMSRQESQEKGLNISTITLNLPKEIWKYEVLNLKNIVEGPVENFKIANAPGLCYCSTAWGDPNTYENYPRILPAIFLKYKLPKNYQDLKVSLIEGPDWCFQNYDVAKLERDNNYLL